ncbi:hypothetical protein [Methanobrevibacter sp.]
MKATKLLEEIRANLKDYPIEYLRNKVTDDRYKDPLTKPCQVQFRNLG